MFTIFGGTEARRLPGRFQVPWRELLIAAIVLVVAGGLVYGVRLIVVSNDNSAPAVVPVVQQPGAQPVQPAVVAPVVPAWPKVKVEWSEPFLVNSLAELPPVEKGFYRGTADGEDGSGSVGTNDPNAPVNVYVRKILPQLDKKMVLIAGVARDAIDKDIVFATIWATLPVGPEIPVDTKTESYGYLLLSVDGEKSWQQISSFTTDGWSTPLSIRVMRAGETLTLFVRDGKFVAPMWRKATVSLKSLP